MDIRDILKSFDSLSEAKTTTDKGVTTHKGDYGREFDTDEEGNAVVKKVKSTEPKPKGRRPDPDRPKLGKDDPKNKKVGDLFGRTTGAVPKGKKGTAISGKSQSHPDNKKDDGTGDEEPTSKKSLKEYFDQLDQALNEEGYSTAPMPGAVAVKDASGKVVATAKNPAAAAAFEKGDITIGGDEQGMAEGSGDNLYSIALQRYPQIKQVDRETVINALNGAYEDYLMHYGYEGIGPEEESSMIDHAVKGLKQGMDEGVLDTVKSAVGLGKKPPATTAEKNAAFHAANKGQNMPSSGNTSVDYDRFTGRDKVNEKDVGKHNNATTGFDALVRKLTPKYGKEAATKIAGAQLKKMSEAEQPQHDAQSSPLSTANRGVLEGKGDFSQAIKNLHGWDEVEPDEPDTRQFDFDDDEDGYDASGTVVQDLKTGKIKVDFTVNNGYYGTDDIHSTFDSIGDAMNVLGTISTQKRYSGGKSYSRDSLAPKSLAGPDDVYKTDRAGKIGTLTKGRMGNMKASSQYTMRGGPKGVLPEGKKGVNPFAKKDTKKKPDANKNGIPDYAEDGKGKNDLTKKGAAPKKGVNPFAKKDEKKKVKEGMEHHLQAARLEGKSHALRKMPYNCTHDDMEEARCYHDGFKEGLDECYGQMPILGRTRVGEMGQGPEVDTMASYGADELGEMDKTSYMKQQAIKTPGGTFKAFGQTMHDSNVLDEFAFEAFDSQLKALLESEEKVSEGMTVSISKGQQGSPDSVSVSAQDGEADQLLSIIKSAGMGLFGGDEQNGYGAPQGSAGAHGGISVVDDHDGMMTLMKKLSGNGGDMSGGGDYEDEEGHEGHGEEEHTHGHEETCESCGGTMEENHQCDSQEMVDEVQSRNQMLYNVAEDNPPNSGADNTNADVADQVGSDKALATVDAAQDMATAKTYSSPTNEAEDETGEEAGKKKEEETVAESFANLYKKLAFLSEESTSEKDEKAEKAGKKVANDIEDDEGHKGNDDNKAEKAGKKVTKDIEYDDKKDEKYKKDKKVDESYANSADDTFEADIDFMTKVISGGLNKQKSTGQTTIPVINGQKSRMGVDGLGNPLKESTDLLKDYMKLSGL